MNESTEVIRQIGDQLAALATVPAAAATDDDLVAFAVELERAGRFVDALRTRAAAELDERSSSRLDGLSDRYGFRTGAQLLEFLTRVSPAEAARRVRLGRATISTASLVGDELPPKHPRVAAALQRGEIGVDSANIIIRCLDQASPHASVEDLEVAEAELVDAAAHDGADLIAVQARAWREALDADGAEPRDERIQRLRSFRIGRENENGLTPFSGAADPYFAGLLRTALNNANRPGVEPRFLSETDRQTGLSIVESDEGEVIEGVTDPRTRDQRNYDVLQGVVTAGLRSTGTKTGEMRDLAQVTAVITMDDLESGSGVAWIDDVTEPVSAATTAEVVCAKGLAKIIIGENGEPLYLGKHKRYFTAAQMRALAVRDGGCVWPGCGAPAAWAEGHHVRAYADGGPTDIDNGVLLCRYHHHKLHRSGFQIRMIDARPHMLLTPAMDPAQRWRPVGKSRIEAVQVRREKAG
ncbi:HNH endonuclease signature motif containing protein [Conyzicola nivalis]|uniref:HNH endonuclease signature motif containing protein n=1 Tax=Conyzicola nivalis TaxID=1477021 RepID=UPI00166EDA7F|nr:HNH endonuclease signature motif containing protein [Conyzicola nivalis]